MVMHACPNCGAPIAPHAIECPKCGACFGEGSSWRPLHPIERRDRRKWSPIAWFVSLSLVVAGLAVIPLLSYATEVLTMTLLVLPTAALGGHLIWGGVRLIRTRDFSGTKLHGAIDPNKLATASYYFGVWKIGLAC